MLSSGLGLVLGGHGLEMFGTKAIAEGAALRSGVDPVLYEQGTELIRAGSAAQKVGPALGTAGMVILGSTMVYYAATGAFCAADPSYGASTQ